MAEGQVTVENKSHRLDELFFVMATQNPIEQHGTFPLPEAQLDRFMIKMSLGYPNKGAELSMLKNQVQQHPLSKVNQVIEREDIVKIRNKIPQVKIHEKIYEYVLSIVTQTRNHPGLIMGASPRASIALIKLGQSLSLLGGDDFVRPDHIYQIAPFVLGHRVILSPEARYTGMTSETLIEEILKQIPIPTGVNT
jgi:MoxR-like ATPase